MAGWWMGLLGNNMGLIVRFLSGVVDALYPRYCLGCGKEGDNLCTECDRSLHAQWIDADSHVAVCDYHERLFASLLHTWKFRFDRQAGEVLLVMIDAQRNNVARFMREKGVEVIVPIPSHEKRVRERGFEPTREIGDRVAGIVDVPCVEVLRRGRYTEHQTNLSKEKRAEQMRESPFEIHPAHEKTIHGRIVLLVDDVVTTGSTMDASERVLLEGGALKVVRFSLGYTV